MRKNIMFVVLFLLGLMVTVVGADAAGLTTKVNGLLRKDVNIFIDGKKSAMEPVFINGKSYLPVREVAEAVGYGLNWNEETKSISLWDSENMILTEGVVVSNKQDADGSINFELIGEAVQGPRLITRVVLRADPSTQITDPTGQSVSLQTLKVGSHINAYFGPTVLNSNPPQAYAYKIIINDQRSLFDGSVEKITTTNDIPQLVLRDAANKEMILNIGENSILVTSDGDKVSLSDIKPGAKILAYYVTAVSNPQQSNNDAIAIFQKK